MAMENHLRSRNIPGIKKTKGRRMKKVRVKMNGIIIVKTTNIKALLKMGWDRQMESICREVSRDTSVKTSFNLKYTLCH